MRYVSLMLTVMALAATAGWADGTPKAGGEEYSAYLENIEIRREFRRQGIGSRLLDVAQQEALARGKRLLWLHADEGNVNAHQFYKHNGWVHEKTVYPAWKQGRHTRVYRKEL